MRNRNNHYRRTNAVGEWVSIFLIAVSIALLGSLNALYASYFYGDWKCGFMECRKIVETPE